MDEAAIRWHNSDMNAPHGTVPTFALYGETARFPDIAHVESISDRARGLGWSIAPHRHLELHQILFLGRGRAEVSIDGVRTDLDGPALVNLPPGTVHSFRFADDVEGHVVTLPVPEWPDLFGPQAETALSWPFAGAVPSDLLVCVEAVTAAHRDTRPHRRLRLLAAVHGLVLAMLDVGGLPSAAASQPDPRVERLRAMAEATPTIRLGVEDCARALGLSPRHLTRLCRAATGGSAQTVLDAAVLREACRLLAYTRLQVATVGHRLGFDDPSYFTRFFRRHTGLSPRAYRLRFDGGPPGPETTKAPREARGLRNSG